MEGQENQSAFSPVTQEVPVPVGSNQSKKGANKWLFIFLGLLIFGGAGIFFFASKSSDSQPTSTPSFMVTDVGDATPLPESSGSPEPVDKTDITIEIQNGTGVAGEAAYLQGKLKALDYTKIEAGNASKTDYEATEVTFKKGISQTVQDEIKTELEDIYKKVTVKTSSTQDSDIVIITGLRGNQTAKPAATSTAKPTSVSSPSSSPTASPTPTGN